MLKFFFKSVSILLLLNICLGGGFGLYEFGASASALSGAVVAKPWDASTVFYNPSGLAFLEGTQFYGGITLISAKNKFIGVEPLYDNTIHESKSAIHTPLGVYFSHQINEKLAAGIGLTNPFGLGLEWEDDFPGRAIAYNTDLKTFYISPVIAYKVMDGLSIGGGLDLVLGSVTLERAVYPFLDDGWPGIEAGTTKIEGSSKLAVGFTLSSMYQAEKWGLGFLYRHKVKQELEDGDATFEAYDTPAGLLLPDDQKVSTSITCPNFLSAGVYYKVLDNLGVELDYMWYNWSVFDKIVFEFKDYSLEVPENYENSIQVRVGVHYDWSPAIQIRMGYIYDQTPQPVESVSPMLPDNTRNDFSFGLGYTHNNMKFDAGFMVVLFGERSTVENGAGMNENGFNGTYSSVANLFFVSYGINL